MSNRVYPNYRFDIHVFSRLPPQTIIDPTLTVTALAMMDMSGSAGYSHSTFGVGSVCAELVPKWPYKKSFNFRF